MSKKSKFLFFSLLLTLYLTFIGNYGPSQPLVYVLVFAVIAIVLAGVSLWDYLSGIEYFTLLVLPGLFSLGMAQTLLQFPNFSRLFKIIFDLVFLIFYYTLLLSLNIFNVASEKPIPLLRAAYATSFVITVFTSFPLFTIVYKGHFGLVLETFLIVLVCLILSFQSLWTVFLPKSQNLLAGRLSLLISLLMFQIALVISFFPTETFFRSALLSTFFYILLGSTHQHLKKSLNLRSISEYVLVGALVSALVFLY